MIRFRLSALFAAGAIAAIVAGTSHAAAAAGKPAPTPSPSASLAPAPTATAETLDKRIPRLEGMIKDDPNNKDAMTELATDYLQVNRPDLAAALTQKLLTGGTKNAQIYFVDGEAQALLGKADPAIASMEQAANLEPTNIQVLQALTQMYMRANRPSDAERVAKRALTFNANSKEAAENYGFVLAAQKKFDEARAQFEAAAKMDPKDPHPVVLEAQTYEDANALPLAMQLLDRALAIAPNDLESLAGKAELASAQHDVKTSVATYGQILALMKDDSTRANVTDQMAMAYAREKMDTDADATFRKAIDSYGNLPAAHIAYGDYLESKQNKDHTGALREWTTAVGPNRDNPLALGRLGQAAAQSNDFPKAVEYFKRLTEVVGKDPAPWVLLGQSYMATKNWTAAHDAFRASFNLAPSADALVGLAAADQQMRNYTEAIQIYQVLDKNAGLTKAPGLLYNMAVAYQSANQPQKAKAAYVRLLATQKPGTQGYSQVQQLIAKIDHPVSSSSTRPAPKASAKPAAKTAAKAGPKPTPSATPKK